MISHTDPAIDVTKTNNLAIDTVIANRYEVRGLIGQGNMGSVFSAWDRLMGMEVAMKRLRSRPHVSKNEFEREALAREAQILGTLYHPNIVTVMDFGFDNQLQPFLVMPLLKQPKDIVTATYRRNIRTKLRLFVQLLQALEYLHRRGIVHRDLKPSNVLVIDNQVKLVDFSFSMRLNESQESSGTLAYLAPERVLQAFSASPNSLSVDYRKADIFSAGLLLYQMIVGDLPYTYRNDAELVEEILEALPDLSQVGSLRQIIGLLLEKNPEYRPGSASQVIDFLSNDYPELVGDVTEPEADSLLRIPPLIGREKELALLSTVLDDAMRGKGSIWFLVGEVGVGKSRLLSELRLKALVRGAVVLRADESSDVGISVNSWRSILPHLVLASQPTNFQAGVLKQVIPEIEQLLERQIGSIPQLAPKQLITRLFRTVAELLAQVGVPLVIILEELEQASDETIDFIAWLAQNGKDIPLLLLCSYRRNEFSLANPIPGAQELVLDRLTEENTHILSKAILGDTESTSRILGILYHESEGNPLFLIETIHALIRFAGKQGRFGKLTLPTHIDSDRVNTIIQQHLKGVPEASREFLQTAALIGNSFATPLLRHIYGNSISTHLRECANLEVLKQAGNTWHFTHDKLREQIERGLTRTEKKAKHRIIAESIEEVYANDLSAHYSRLAYHWREAGDKEKELHWTLMAGDQARDQLAYTDAAVYFERAVTLMPSAKKQERFNLLLELEEIYHVNGLRPQQEATLSAISHDVDQMKTINSTVAAAIRRMRYYNVIGDFEQSILIAVQTINRVKISSIEEIRLHYYLAETYILEGNFAQALSTMNAGFALLTRHSIAPNSLQATELNLLAIGLLRNLALVTHSGTAPDRAIMYNEQALQLISSGYPSMQADLLKNLGRCYVTLNEWKLVARFYDHARQIFESIGDLYGRTQVYTDTAYVAICLGHYILAHQHLNHALTLVRQGKDTKTESRIYSYLGILSFQQGYLRRASDYFKQSLELARQIAAHEDVADSLSYLALLEVDKGSFDSAQQYCNEALEIAKNANYANAKSIALTESANIAFYHGKIEVARTLHTEALELRIARKEQSRILESLVGLAQVNEVLNDHIQLLHCADQMLAILKTNTSDGATRPLNVYWTLYCVLCTLNDDRAEDALAAGHEQVLKRYAGLEPADAETFLRASEANRELYLAGPQAGNGSTSTPNRLVW